MNIFRAVKKQDKSKILESLSRGYKLDYRKKNGMTPLMLAVRINSLEIVEYLISIGADINIVKKDGYSALTFACDNKNIKIIEFLIKNKADISVKDHWNRSLIMHLNLSENCDFENYKACFKLLTLNGCIPVSGEYLLLLYQAIKLDNIYMIEFFMESGADINYYAKTEPCYYCSITSALHYSVNYGNMDMVRFLVEKGADININSFILLDALGIENEEKYKYLLKQGASPNAVNSYGDNIAYRFLRDRSYRFNDDIDKIIMRLKDLLEYGLDINAENSSNLGSETLLHYVAAWIVCERSIRILKFLLENGADPTIKDKRNISPLEVALGLNRKVHAEIIEKFIKSKT